MRNPAESSASKVKLLLYLKRFFITTRLQLQMSSYLTLDAILSPICLAIVLLVSSYSYFLTILLQLIAVPTTFFITNRYYPSVRFNSNFYLSWAISSYVFIIAAFEFEVVPYLEILVYENAVFLIFAGLSFICAMVVRYKSLQYLSQSMVTPKNFKKTYCCWLKCTIDASNRWSFVSGLIIAIIGLLYGSHLMVTTVCHVSVQEFPPFGDFLVPYDCSDVYLDGHIAFTYTCSVYSFLLAIFLTGQVILTILATFGLKRTSRSTTHSSSYLLKLVNFSKANNNSSNSNCSGVNIESQSLLNSNNTYQRVALEGPAQVFVPPNGPPVTSGPSSDADN